MMSATAGLRRIHKTILALIITVATAIGLMVAGPGAGTADAEPRGWLRPDATGVCEWDTRGWWMQRCDVYSPAMGYYITVQIQPAARGGNAAYYLLDGLRAMDHTNACC